MILVVDDDASVRASLSLLLRQAGHSVEALPDPAAALERLAAGPCELVLSDMNFSRRTSGDEGLELLREIKRRWPRLPVLLLTAWGSIPLAVEGMRAGAADFVTKPWNNAQVLQAVRTALGLAQMAPSAADPPPTRRELDRRFGFGELCGEDPRFLRVLDLLARVAPTDASVLVTGESGTGKELVAAAVHRLSRRSAGPFVKVNLGGIATSLFESEMFGHVRGAFTDARSDRQGRFALADGGTIFLDEIGELDPGAQVKLLRVLQDRTYEVLGSSQTRSVDVRVVAATNRDLPQLVSEGRFREDLLYRLNLIGVHLPPLRERPADVSLLARRFAAAAAQTFERPELRLSPGALAWLARRPWPGNVRQLRQWVERAALVAPRETLEEADFQAMAELEAPEGARDPLPAVGSMTLDEIERAMIVKSLRHHAGNVTRAAESLGMSRPALYRRLEKYGLDA